MDESKNLSRDHMDELWRRMTDIFAHQWSSAHGTHDSDDTWLRGLSGLTPEDLSVGLTACANMKPDEDGKIFAPTLPMFKSMCRPKDTRAPYHEIFKGLPAPEISKEDALAHIAAIRQKLNT